MVVPPLPLLLLLLLLLLLKRIAIPVTGRGYPQDFETSRLPHFLDNRLTDGGEVVNTYAPAAIYSEEDSWYSFLLEAVSIPGPQCGWKN
jgi:hypothetical protein